MDENQKEVALRLHKIRQSIEELKRAEVFCEAELLGSARDILVEQLGDKDYGAGTVNLPIEGVKVKVVVSKKVSYDQDGLKSNRQQLADNGEDPDEYIKVKYDVSEAAYKSWPTSLKKMFEPYRTVEVSKPKIIIEV
jgi:hypothetical protein